MKSQLERVEWWISHLRALSTLIKYIRYRSSIFEYSAQRGRNGQPTICDRGQTSTWPPTGICLNLRRETQFTANFVVFGAAGPDGEMYCALTTTDSATNQRYWARRPACVRARSRQYRPGWSSSCTYRRTTVSTLAPALRHVTRAIAEPKQRLWIFQ